MMQIVSCPCVIARECIVPGSHSHDEAVFQVWGRFPCAVTSFSPALLKSSQQVPSLILMLLRKGVVWMGMLQGEKRRDKKNCIKLLIIFRIWWLLLFSSAVYYLLHVVTYVQRGTYVRVVLRSCFIENKMKARNRTEKDATHCTRGNVNPLLTHTVFFPLLRNAGDTAHYVRLKRIF
jgi:hypothetical protein